MFEFIKSKFFKSDKSADPGEIRGQGLVARLKQIKWREQVYLIASLILMAAIFLVFYEAVIFIAGAIVKSFEVDEAAVQSQVVRFNLEDYEKIVPKLIKK